MTAEPALHIARDSAGVDIDAARRAAADFLSALGIDMDREDLRETPARMARAFAELFSARPLRLTTFANDEGYDELVLARAKIRGWRVSREFTAEDPGYTEHPGAYRPPMFPLSPDVPGSSRETGSPASPPAPRLVTGSLADLVAHHHVTGVTTNPTIFAKAIAGGDDAYAGQLHDLWVRGTSVEEALRALTTHDVRWACDVLRPVYDATGGVDGRVSIEVDPRLAHDTDATIAEARALWFRVDRPNLFIKIPAARQGLPAIAACLAEGISVNITLIFSLARYDAVIDAFLDGLEGARAAGLDLVPIASVASFFVSRVDAETDARLDKIGTGLAAFDASWRELSDQVAAALRRPRQGHPRQGHPRQGQSHPREKSEK